MMKNPSYIYDIVMMRIKLEFMLSKDVKCGRRRNKMLLLSDRPDPAFQTTNRSHKRGIRAHRSGLP
jgi:hypothetical protein